MKLRMVIERKNGRVTPGNRGVKTVHQKTDDPFSFFHFVFSVLLFFVVQYLDFKPDAKRFNLSKSLHVEA